MLFIFLMAGFTEQGHFHGWANSQPGLNNSYSQLHLHPIVCKPRNHSQAMSFIFWQFLTHLHPAIVCSTLLPWCPSGKIHLPHHFAKYHFNINNPPFLSYLTGSTVFCSFYDAYYQSFHISFILSNSKFIVFFFKE